MATKPDIGGAVERLSAYAFGQEIAADCERRILAAYAPELERWEACTKDHDFRSDDELNAKVRNALDARDNADRFAKVAADIRTVLAALATESGK